MDAYGRKECRIFLGQADARFKIRRTIAGSNCDHALHTRVQRPLDYFFAIAVKLLAVQMTVGVDQTHLTLAPTGTSSRNPASTGLPPSSEAATIMPFDSTPRSLRGSRLATITTLRPIRSSGA